MIEDLPREETATEPPKRWRDDRVPVSEVRRSLAYNPYTGLVHWRRNAGRTLAGEPAGTVNSQGYVTIKFGGVMLQAHRVAWLLFHGEWPKMDIDHINRWRTDNRIGNLREATFAENNLNTGTRSDNTSGFRGVSPAPKRPGWWRADIRIRGKRHALGLFSNIHDAAAAYERAALERAYPEGERP